MSLKALSALMLAGLCASASAEPLVIDDMPPTFDGVTDPEILSPVLGIDLRVPALKPVAVDFDGDGQPEWYAGGNNITRPRIPTPLDPSHYETVALPAMSALNVCPSCTPRYRAFAVADLNSDGRTDIVRLNDWNGQDNVVSLQVFLGNSSGGFNLGWREDKTLTDNSEFGSRLFQIALSDVDRDGAQDLVVLSTFEYVNNATSPYREEGSLVIRSNTNGQFGAPQVLQTRNFSSTSELYILDYERDGDPDIMVTHQILWNSDGVIASDETRWFYNDGGSFSAATNNILGTVDGGYEFMDFDRDSWPDFMTVAGGDVGWRANLKEGSFAGNIRLFALSQYSPAAAFADFDENGTIDVLTAEGTNNRQIVLRKGATTGCNCMATGSTLLGTLPSSVVQASVGDARGDADNDVMLRLADGSFRLARNEAQRLRPYPASSTLVGPLTGITRLAVADVNRDGIEDLLALQPSGAHLYLQTGNSNSGFDTPTFKTLGGTATDFAVADFNRDDRLDYAYVLPAEGAVRVVTQNDAIFFGWSDAKIADDAGASLIRAGNGAGYNGSPDLLIGTNIGGLHWLVNHGSAPWTTSTVSTTLSPSAQSLAVLAHFTGIGDSPVACRQDGLSLLIDGYSAIFGWVNSLHQQEVLSTAQTGFCTAIEIDDKKGAELVFESGNGRLVWWSPPTVSAATYKTIDTSVPGQVNAVTTTDWNRDGMNDLLVATSNGLYVYVREGLDEHWARTKIDNGVINGVVAIDINRDSRPDAVDIVAGALRYVFNSADAVALGDPILPGGDPLVLAPGASAPAIRYDVINPGRSLEDAGIAVTRATVVFRKAQQSGNSWSMGAAMTAAEVGEAVSSVSLVMDGYYIGTGYPANVQSDGSMKINYTAFGALVPIAADSSKALEIRVTLKSTAATASYGDFYIAQGYFNPTFDTEVRVLHGGNPVGITADATPFVTSRVHIVGDSIFKNGFE